MLISLGRLAGKLTQRHLGHLKTRIWNRDYLGRPTSGGIVSLNATITEFMRAGAAEKARRLFDEMPQRDVVTWNAMVSGYCKNGRLREARQFFDQMPRRDIISWNAMIMGYVHNSSLEEARKLFNVMPERNVTTWNLLVGGYADEANVRVAQELFQRMPERDVASWTILIAAFAGEGWINDARKLFDEMPERDVRAWNTMISGYVKNERVEIAESLFVKMPRRDTCSWLELINGYVSFRRLGDAIKLFIHSPDKPIVSWNAIIMGLIDCGLVKEAHALFEKTPWKHMVSGTNLTVGYFDVGDVRAARKLFDSMLVRDEVTWNAAISGYSKNELREEGLNLYVQMHEGGVKPDHATFVSVLSIISSLPSLDSGRQAHGQIMKFGFDSVVAVGNALITMYARCGSITSSLRKFQYMINHDVISWNSIICGYAQHGNAKQALDLFEQMRLTDTKPNEITFINVLNSCSHAGLVDKGRYYFNLMQKYYCIGPTSEHYTCMVDLLGRYGFLDEALKFICEMKSHRLVPSASIWGALLGACRTHGNVELGELAAKQALLIEPCNAAAYLMLFDLYTAQGKRQQAGELLALMREKDKKKYSAIFR
ncbi:Pentatricopeptide repeat-containing protein [Nymphaea thermarum]|nr:Pentatricopeptide repeat-containing protein [Nymphaea thermarum]